MGSDPTRCPVELDFFQQGAADALNHLTFHLVTETIRIYDRARVDAHSDFGHRDGALVLIDTDFRNHGAVAVKPLIQDAGEAPPCDYTGLGIAFVRTTGIPARFLCDGVDHM